MIAVSQKPPRFFNLIFFALVAALMSGAVSFVVTLVNLWPEPGIFFEWLKAWAFAFPIAYPVAMIVSPPCRTFTLRLLGHSETGASDKPS